MGTHVSHPKPDLSRFATREVVIPPTRAGLEGTLLHWISDAVTHTKHPPYLHGRQMPYARALLFEAEGIDDMMHVPPSMALGSGGRKMTVDAKFYFDHRQSDGNWFVTHIKFIPRLSSLQKQAIHDSEEDEKQAQRNRIRAEYAAKYRSSPIGRAFLVENYLDTYDSDIDKGKMVIHRMIEAAYDGAHEAAAIPDNPESPKDVGLSLAGGALKAGGEDFEKVSEAFEKGTEGAEMMEYPKKMMEEEEALRKGEEGLAPWQGAKTKGDIYLEKGIDLASKIPAIGPFVKGFAGMLYDFASANYAGEVTKVRCRAYLWFVAGFILSLTPTAGKETPTHGFDTHFYTLGRERAPGLSADEKYQAQLYLLEYVRDGHWLPGQVEGIRNETRQDWTFPRDYIGHWSPELLAKALTAQLHQKRYLVD